MHALGLHPYIESAQPPLLYRISLSTSTRPTVSQVPQVMSFIPDRRVADPPLSEVDASVAGPSSLSKGISSSIKEHEPSWRERLAQSSPLIAEFVGCTMQALAWNCTALGQESSKTGEFKPLVVGLTLMVSTYCFASVSGAHLNPAVSLSVGLSNMGDWRRLGKYIGVQALGSAAGVALSCATYQKTLPAGVGPRNGFHISNCLLVEFFYTAMLCIVYLNVTLSRSNNSVKAGNQFFALAIGFAMAAGCWASEDISGALFNPALALAVDFQNVKNGVGHGLAYMFAEIMGAFLAAVAYRVMRPSEDVDDHEQWIARQELLKDKDIAYPKLVAEGAGTFLVVFTFGMTTMSKLYKDSRPFAAAAAIMTMHYSVADLSGGHFNPAVTLAAMLSGRGKCSVNQGLAFIATQIVCAALAAFFYTAIRASSFPAVPVDARRKYGLLPMSAVDAIFAFSVCYTALATTTVVGVKSNLQRNYFDGLAYGFSSAAGGFATLSILNSLANPAMTLGLALAYMAMGDKPGHAEAFNVALFQFLGGAIASGVFRFTHAAEYRRHREGEYALLMDREAKGAFDGHASASSSQRLR